jgi:hypothetical protein
MTTSSPAEGRHIAPAVGAPPTSRSTTGPAGRGSTAVMPAASGRTSTATASGTSEPRARCRVRPSTEVGRFAPPTVPATSVVAMAMAEPSFMRCAPACAPTVNGARRCAGCCRRHRVGTSRRSIRPRAGPARPSPAPNRCDRASNRPTSWPAYARSSRRPRSVDTIRRQRWHGSCRIIRNVASSPAERNGTAIEHGRARSSTVEHARPKREGRNRSPGPSTTQTAP